MNLDGRIQIWNDKVDFLVKDEDQVQGGKDDNVDKVEERCRDSQE